jgi:protein-disulfide isomerase
MSKRDEMRRRRQQKTRQRQLGILGAVSLLAVTVTAWLIWQNTRPIGDIVSIEPREWPMADGAALGPAGAPVLIQEFSDFQCSFCRQFAQGVKNRLVEEYISTGQVRLEHRHYIVVDSNAGGNESRRAAEASECAREQGQFWNYYEILFANQNRPGSGTYADRRLKAFAETLGLDTGAFNACFDGRRYSSQVQADQSLGDSLGVRGTPTLFVNGIQVQNPLNFAEFQSMIDPLLAR